FALIALGAHGAVSLWQDAAERRRGRVVLGVAMLAVVFAVSFFAKRNDEAGDLSQRYYNLSASFLNDGRVAEAEALARRAAEEGPRNHLPYLTLAEAASVRGDTRAEAAALGQAFERKPDDDEIRARLVRLRSRTEGYGGAAAMANAWLAGRESYRLRQALVAVALGAGGRGKLRAPGRAAVAASRGRRPRRPARQGRRAGGERGRPGGPPPGRGEALRRGHRAPGRRDPAQRRRRADLPVPVERLLRER